MRPWCPPEQNHNATQHIRLLQRKIRPCFSAQSKYLRTEEWSTLLQHLGTRLLWTVVEHHAFCPFVLLRLSSINLNYTDEADFIWCKWVRTLSNLHHAVCPELWKSRIKCWSHPLMLQREKPCCCKYSFDWNTENKRNHPRPCLPVRIWQLKAQKKTGQGLCRAAECLGTCKSLKFSLGHRMIWNSSSQEATAPMNGSLSTYYRCINSHVYLQH